MKHHVTRTIGDGKQGPASCGDNLVIGAVSRHRLDSLIRVMNFFLKKVSATFLLLRQCFLLLPNE